MKKKVAIFLCLLMCLSLISCGKQNNSNVTKETSVSQETVKKESAKQEEKPTETGTDSENEEEQVDDSETASSDNTETKASEADLAPYDFSITWIEDYAVFKIKESYLPPKADEATLELVIPNQGVEYDLPLTVLLTYYVNENNPPYCDTSFLYRRLDEDLEEYALSGAESGPLGFMFKDGWYISKMAASDLFWGDDAGTGKLMFINFNTTVRDITGTDENGREYIGIQEISSDRSILDEIDSNDPYYHHTDTDISFLSDEDFNTIPFKDNWKLALKMTVPNVYIYDFGEWPISDDSQSFLVTGYHKTSADVTYVMSETGESWSKVVFENDTDMLNRDPWMCGYTARNADNHVSSWDEFDSYNYKMKWFVTNNSREDWDAIIDGNTIIYPSYAEDAFYLLGMKTLTNTDGSDFFKTLMGLESGEHTLDLICTVQYEDFKFLEENSIKHSREITEDESQTTALVIVK